MPGRYRAGARVALAIAASQRAGTLGDAAVRRLELARFADEFPQSQIALNAANGRSACLRSIVKPVPVPGCWRQSVRAFCWAAPTPDEGCTPRGGADGQEVALRRRDLAHETPRATHSDGVRRRLVQIALDLGPKDASRKMHLALL